MLVLVVLEFNPSQLEIKIVLPLKRSVIYSSFIPGFDEGVKPSDHRLFGSWGYIIHWGEPFLESLQTNTYQRSGDGPEFLLFAYIANRD